MSQMEVTAFSFTNTELTDFADRGLTVSPGELTQIPNLGVLLVHIRGVDQFIFAEHEARQRRGHLMNSLLWVPEDSLDRVTFSHRQEFDEVLLRDDWNKLQELLACYRRFYSRRLIAQVQPHLFTRFSRGDRINLDQLGLQSEDVIHLRACPQCMEEFMRYPMVRLGLLPEESPTLSVA